MVHEVDGPSDALSRAWRTFGQGAVVAALVAVATVLSTLAGDPDWKLVAMACGQAAVTAVVTYVHNSLKPVS